MKNYYFLFGQEAVQAYLDEDIDYLINLINEENLEYEVCHYGKDSEPTDLLYTYNGYSDYAVISEEEYNKINKLS